MASQEHHSEGHSYFHILKTMVMIGGSSLVNVLFSIVRNKTLAVLLGPAGIGQVGLYQSIVDLTQTLAGCGVASSGVRQIAEATGTGDNDRIARTATVLRRTSIVLGLLGAITLAALAQPIARLTFSDDQHVYGVALLSVAVVLQLAAGGQVALIQGLRDIGGLARMQIISGLASTTITIVLVYMFGPSAIAPAIVAGAAALLVTCWWFSRKVAISPPRMTFREIWQEVVPLMQLGFVFMLAGLMGYGASYIVRLFVLWEEGIAAAGQYHAAWVLGGIYAGFILQAMGADFYPRLTAVANDHAAVNRLVNQQTQVSLLLAAPGVLATLTFASVAMWLFYTPEFYPAANILRWICLGMLLRIIAWPMGFIMVAKGRRVIFLVSDATAFLVHIGLAWLLVPRFGPIGSGIAFFGLYAWHCLFVYCIARKLSQFRWSPANLKLTILFLMISGLVFCATVYLPPWQGMAVGTLATILSGLYSLHYLVGLMPPESLPSPIRTWVAKSAVSKSA
ncbi:O-antigen translocase [Mycoplana rhizolycopersici]|uniref:O-antigen translocase n=1 Tax=Mycoplana rhizolycopersici TaxID=2746702 RepID=A0ABX2QKJ0_9HYPH|nr:O-antigen translocase [Rhizobium rhizolycopersici]NVP56819.1 O-antigen translocase [Rhizobium rhizolycopersici]